MSHKQTRASSNYARHAKRPHVYSDLYQRWHATCVRTGSNQSDDALELDAAFRRREGLGARTPEDPTLYVEDFAEAAERR
jgi:hypothetical protein